MLDLVAGRGQKASAFHLMSSGVVGQQEFELSAQINAKAARAAFIELP